MRFQGDQWTVAAPAPLDQRLPAFVPGWKPGPTGPGRALLAVTARFVQLLADRLGQAPDKAKLALLDALGVTALSAQPARCPVVFELMPGAGHGKAPARTQLQAKVTDRDAALIFETTDDIGLAASRLVDVKGALPGSQLADHTPQVLGAHKFKLFEGPQLIPRELYLAHDTLLALTPSSVLEIQIELGHSSPVGSNGTVTWQYWDGNDWAAFVEADTPPAPEPPNAHRLRESTRNLQRGGTVRLQTGTTLPASQTIRGQQSYWIRGVEGQLHTDPPQVSQLRLRTINSVLGFSLFSRKEKLPSAGKPQLRVRLVDEAGTPLAQDQYEVVLWPIQGPPSVLTAGDKDYRQIDNKGADVLIRIRMVGSTKKPPEESILRLSVPRPDRSYDYDLARAGRLPEMLFGNGLKLDPTTSFFPFGQQPQPGATLLLSCPEVTSKPGARVTVFVEVSPETFESGSSPSAAPVPPPRTRWEYWNGLGWATLPDLEFDAPEVAVFRKSGQVRFTMPSNLVVKKELGQEKQWLRVQLEAGGYLFTGAGVVQLSPRNILYDKVVAPVVQTLRLAYELTSDLEPPRFCLARNNFGWEDFSNRVLLGGDPFEPFHPPADTLPTLYLGFSRTLPTDLVSLFFDVRSAGEPGLAWEYWNGTGWASLTLQVDQTKGLSMPGLIQFIWPGTSLPDPELATKADQSDIEFPEARQAARFQPGDSVAVFQNDDAELAVVAAVAGTALTLTAPLEKKFTNPLVGFASAAPFGTPRQWVRVVWPRDLAPGPGSAGEVLVQAIYLNAVWAEQAASQGQELLGTTTGTGGEVFDFAKRPVCENEKVEVLELDGALADAGWALLAQELKAAGKSPDADLRLEPNPTTGKVARAWVRWDGRDNFAASGPKDRHYVVDRARGQLQFGDGEHGRVPPVNPNNVVATYRSGGGSAGNVPARTVKVVLGSIPGAQFVYNPLPAKGGADGELALSGTDAAGTRKQTQAILDRGPQVVRHRHRALVAQDYEQLALAATPAVALAGAVTPADTRCVVPAGGVRLVVVPADVTDPRPAPSQEVRDKIRDYVQARAPAVTAGRIAVVGPTYAPVGVEAILVPLRPEAAGTLAQNAQSAIARFLHPVAGARDGRGWRFGTAVYPSDLVAYLHDNLAAWLAYVERVTLLDAGVPLPEEMTVAADQLPCAGPVRILLRTEEVKS